MNRKRTVAYLLPWLLLVISCAVKAQTVGPIGTRAGTASGESDKPNSKASAPQRYEQGGIAVEFFVTLAGDKSSVTNGLVAGANALASFRVTDSRTGQPVTGLHPSAWISSRMAGTVPNAAECKDKISSFMGGLLSSRPDIDLNSYLILTINHDNTISVINPQVGFNRTKLEHLIVLPGAAADWVLTGSSDLLYVTMPEQSAVAVVDTLTSKLIGTIKLKEGTRPRRIVLEPEANRVWVGLDDSPYVTVIDTKTNSVAATINVGEGLHQIEFVPGGRFAYVTNSKANTVSAIDRKKLAKISDLEVGATPVPIAYSPASRLLYVASLNGTTLSVIDPVKQKVVQTIPTDQGVVALRFSPDGRFGFLVNQVKSKVSLLDVTTNKIVGSTSVAKEPDQVTFTKRYAYIHATGSEKFSLIELTDFTKSTPAPVEIQGGQKVPSTMPEEIGVAGMIAPTPEGNAVMIANNPDTMIYYYVEGMMAPMGTFSNYKRRPRALLVLDRSLRENAAGTYSTQFKLTRSGIFDVPLLIDQPRLLNCFQLEVGSSPDGELQRSAPSIAVEAMLKDEDVKAGEHIPLKFKITDTVTKEPLRGINDVTVLVFEPPGIWQQRQIARETSAGVYEVMQLFPRAGIYNVMISVSSRDVRFADMPFHKVKVVAGAP